ncbi:MAG: hypothetical protein ACRD01_00765 [Terriglobales bacterium]
MSDRIRLSLWFSTHTGAEMLPRLQRAAELLPSETLERGVGEVAVTAVSWAEAALLEERFEQGVTLEEAMDQLRRFAAGDCVCELELAWLLWVCEPDWRQSPHALRLSSVGPDFGATTDGQGNDGHLLVDFGLDEPFLAELAPPNTETRRHLQANILQLLAYVKKIEQQLRPRALRLWSEGEGNWLERLAQRLQAADWS